MTSSRPDDLNSDHLPSSRREQEAGSKKPGKPPHPPDTELSAPLETSVPLEAPQAIYVAAPRPPVPTPAPVAPPLVPAAPAPTAPVPAARQSDDVTISLLSERVVVDRKRRKIGEVVVRKEVETRIVEVPVRREKLIVEQISPYYKQLTVVELGSGAEDDAAAETAAPLDVMSVNAEFASIQEAVQFLGAIAADSSVGEQKVQIRLLAVNAAQRDACHRWLERLSSSQS